MMTTQTITIAVLLIPAASKDMPIAVVSVYKARAIGKWTSSSSHPQTVLAKLLYESQHSTSREKVPWKYPYSGCASLIEQKLRFDILSI
jgi:hypothetical protein